MSRVPPSRRDRLGRGGPGPVDRDVGPVRARHARWVAEDDLTRLGGGLLKVQEAEWARIARELHDDISQQLAVVALELDALKGTARLGRQRRARCPHSRNGCARLAADLQRVTRALHPARLEHLGLVPAVRAWVTTWNTRGPHRRIRDGMARHASERRRALSLPRGAGGPA